MSHSNSNVKTYNNYSNKYNPSGSITPMMTMTITYQANTYHNSSTRVRMLNGANGEMGVVKLRPTCTVGSCDSSDRGRCAVQPGSIVLAFNVIHYYSIYKVVWWMVDRSKSNWVQAVSAWRCRDMGSMPHSPPLHVLWSKKHGKFSKRASK